MLNHIVIMGRLTRDPELRRTGTGIAVTSFTVAVDRDFAPKDGGERETDFIDCVAWRSTGEFVSKYFSKGSMAVVSGRLQIRSWTDKDGNKRRSADPRPSGHGVVFYHVILGVCKVHDVSLQPEPALLEAEHARQAQCMVGISAYLVVGYVLRLVVPLSHCHHAIAEGDPRCLYRSRYIAAVFGGVRQLVLVVFGIGVKPFG